MPSGRNAEAPSYHVQLAVIQALTVHNQAIGQDAAPRSFFYSGLALGSACRVGVALHSIESTGGPSRRGDDDTDIGE